MAPPGRTNAADVGDRVAEDQIGSRRLECERLVEVGAPNRIEGDEVDISAIGAIDQLGPRSGRGDVLDFSEDRCGKPIGNVEAPTEFVETSTQAPVVVDEADHPISGGRP